MSFIDLTGTTFGDLEVIERDNSKPSGSGYPVYWICKCKCGNLISIRSSHLKNRKNLNCGCNNERHSNQISEDLVNQRFGKLLVVKKVNDNLGKGARWLCLCDCGNEKIILARYLKESARSCGCLGNSHGENLIAEILINENIEFKTQVSFKDLIGKEKPLRFDFGVYKNNQLKYLIEYQGIQHFEPIEHFGGKEKFDILQEYDKLKKEYCVRNNIEIIYLNYQEEITKEKIIKEELLNDR